MTPENAITNAAAEVTKAVAAWRAALALRDLSLYDDAASRLYYAVFHLMSAALLLLGVQAQTHAGVQSLLGQHLVKTGLLPNAVARDFAILLSLRGQADYNRHFVIDEPGIRDEVERARRLFTAVGQLLASRGLTLPPEFPR